MPEKRHHLYGDSRPRGPLRRLGRTIRLTRKEMWARLEFLAWKLTHRRGAFLFNGQSYPYFWHPYNTAWKNERAVEMAIVLPALAAANDVGSAVLEVGNVLGRYGSTGHTVVDKYDVSPGVRNEDIVDYRPPEGGFNLILSVSTIEHIGWNEEPRQPEKVWRALAHLKTACLAPGGRLLATVPLGYNAEVDRAVHEGAELFREQFYLRRTTPANEWIQCELRDVAGAMYGSPFPWANALLIGIHTRPT